MFVKLYTLLPTLILVWCIHSDISFAHLGEECRLNRCMNSFLVTIKNSFCDDQNICRCEEGFVTVTLHKCAEIQSVGGYCDYDVQCKTAEENAHCDKSHYKSTCECRRGFQWDIKQKKCVPIPKKAKSTPIFPLTAVILIAVIAVFCGCGIICHNFRQNPEATLVHDQRRSSRENRQRRALPTPGTVLPNTAGGSAGIVAVTNHNTSDNISTSSKFDDDLYYDEPPPKYEDAIKEFPTEVVVDSQSKRSHPLTTLKS